MRFSKSSAPKRAREIARRLGSVYPDAHCALHHSSALELLVATILSAQCTDERVNRVTPELFRKYRFAEDYACADPKTLEQEIRSTGFFRNKAKSIRGAAAALVRDHGGEVPDSMEALLKLPGVARKTANVVLGSWFRKAAGVVVDTHVRRLSQRLGLTRQEDPPKIEQDLIKLLPPEEWILFSHRLIWHGRRICRARSPKCPQCALASCCPSAGKLS
jgi:endonuclease-3